MPTTDALLRAAIGGAPDARTLTLDPGFEGLPETAHGGTLLAVIDALAAVGGPREIVGHYRRRVPLGVSLSLDAAHAADGVTCHVRDATATVLVDGHVRRATNVEPTGAPASGDVPLPVSGTCFACGVDNPIGLRARLRFDDRSVAGTWTPDARFLGADGGLATVALTTLLDEAAFWLGALATGESGMTTELRVVLHGRLAGGSVQVSGERAAVHARADDARYWDTRVGAWDESGRLLAQAAITFVTVRGAARRLVNGLLGINPRETLRRIFPAYIA